jgi:choline dehydrogenase
LTLRSADAFDAPAIRPRYLSREYDRKIMLECVRIARTIYAQKAFQPYAGEELHPGKQLQSDDEIMDFVRRRAETIYHPIGTCRMGEDSLAVVDPDLEVRGLEGLSVVDASVMPSLVSGNTNAPTMMIAEKYAAMQ